MVVGSGAYSMVFPRDETRDTELIADELRRTMRGCDVYTREEIPEEMHWKVDYSFRWQK